MALKAIIAQSLIKGVRQIHRADVPVAGPADVRGVHAVRANHAAGKYGADRGGPH